MIEKNISTISCTPSTLNFVCDVDGVHTEIPIPSSAWDFENETVWLTQAQLAELYKVNVPAVSKQIQNIFEDEELQEYSVISKMEITAADGKCYQTKHYNLEMLIALGYRIRSKVATKFRQWATKHLKEWSGMSTMTLNRRLHDLEECERISRLQDFANVNIPTETGAVKTTLYNLNVLNQLAM